MLNNFSTHLQAIRGLLLHCTSELQHTSIGFLKIDAMHDYIIRFPSKLFLSFLNGRGPWCNPFEKKRLTRNERIKFAALEHRRLALITAA